MRAHWAVLLVASLLCTGAMAQDFWTSRPIIGSYNFYSFEVGDWDAPNAKDAKIRFEITGTVAKEMFDHMGAGAEAKACPSAGGGTRRQGNLTCIAETRVGYLCAFGLNLKTGQSTHGMVC